MGTTKTPAQTAFRGAHMLTSVMTTGVPSALLTVLFGALLWVRLDTVWSEEHVMHWLSLGALGAGAGAGASVLHSFMPSETAMGPAMAVAVLAALGWWGYKRGWRHW